MSATPSRAGHVAVTPHDAVHHADPGFWRKYVFSTDHKIIGMQYGFTALIFLLFGFGLVLMMRWQMAYPGKAIPLVGGLLESWLGQVASGGVMSPDLYNARHDHGVPGHCAAGLRRVR